MGHPAIAIYELPGDVEASQDVEVSQEVAAAVWREAQTQPTDSHVAFVANMSVTSADIEASSATDADVTVIVEDAARATGGRGSADLAAVIWQSFPAIAALLSDRVSNAGAVVFSPRAFDHVRHDASEVADPVTAAVATIIANGGSIRAVLMPGDSRSAPPSEPPELAPQVPRSERDWRNKCIEEFDVAVSLGGVASLPDATAIRAGLLLWHDFLDASHRQSQSIEGKGVHVAGDYWHAIMHRRERDYGNAAYWFRHVRRHPICEPLASRVVRHARDGGPAVENVAACIAPEGRWDSVAFCDRCQASEGGSDEAISLFLRRIQADEMLLLLWQTCLDAKGGS